jgi:leader peptidase (prepilin peptidase)/N-methyltransferase
VLGLVLVTLLVPMALIDLDHRIIPNTLTGLGAVLAIALGFALDPSASPSG